MPPPPPSGFTFGGAADGPPPPPQIDWSGGATEGGGEKRGSRRGGPDDDDDEEDDDDEDAIELPESVLKRLMALKELHEQRDAAKEEYKKERIELEKKFKEQLKVCGRVLSRKKCAPISAINRGEAVSRNTAIVRNSRRTGVAATRARPWAL